MAGPPPVGSRTKARPGRVSRHVTVAVPTLLLVIGLNFLLLKFLTPTVFESHPAEKPGAAASRLLVSRISQVSQKLADEVHTFPSHVLETRTEPLVAGNVTWSLERTSLEFPSEAEGAALAERLQGLSFEPLWEVEVTPLSDEPYSSGVLVSISGFPTHVLSFYPALESLTEPQVDLAVPGDADASGDSLEGASPMPGEEPLLRGALMAVLIDDVGYKPEALEELLQMPVAFSVAVIPSAPYAAVSAELAHRHGKEVLVHLPLEPLARPSEGKRSSPGQIRLSMPLSEVQERTRKAIAAVPYAVGLNNHEGSAFMQSRDHVRAMLEVVAAQSLFFVDSRTIGRTVGYEIARSMGIPAAERQVFLDNEANEESIRRAYRRCERVALKEGRALCIGHPYPETLRFLRTEFSTPASGSPTRVPVSALLER